jgi:hypothetical protein
MTDETQIDIDKEVGEHFAQLPKVVQDAITSADVQKRLRELSDKRKFHIDQWQILENEVMLTLLGIQDVTNLASELSTELGISADEANILANDINTIVFEPIRQELERQLESPEAKEKELTGAEAARAQILADAALSGGASGAPSGGPTPAASVAPIAGTPPAAPPIDKAVRAPLSSAYSSRQPSTERKLADGDPYRLPPK